jgi:hypothetical protein
MPVFEDLLPEPFNSHVQDLLFDLAVWLSFAKLRQHTDSTLDHFDNATSSLGQQIRTFSSKVCANFVTTDTPKEKAARTRRKAAKASDNSGKETSGASTKLTAGPKRQRFFKINTYKWHALGDYIRSIQLFGTTDSYSSQTVSSIYLFFLYRH